MKELSCSLFDVFSDENETHYEVIVERIQVATISREQIAAWRNTVCKGLF